MRAFPAQVARVKRKTEGIERKTRRRVSDKQEKKSDGVSGNCAAIVLSPSIH